MSLAECKTIEARVAYIREKLGTSEAWALRGLLRIYANQTADEQASDSTAVDNGIGFTGTDAFILSQMARHVQAWNDTDPSERKYATPLSYRQAQLVLKKMPKYARQLEKLSRTTEAAA